VLAIKQTLYRTGGDPRIIGRWRIAVNNGKQVTAVVNCARALTRRTTSNGRGSLRKRRARGVWASSVTNSREGLPVVRREGHHIRRYVHLATGNYNPSTARLYTDIGLLTCGRISARTSQISSICSPGFCQYQPMRKLLVAPFELHKRMLQ